mgnify:CR=1 FL=1
MRGPRKIDGTLQVNPENVRIIRCYMKGNGTAKQAVAIDFTTTTNGLYHAIAADSDTAAHRATIGGVALEAWTCDTDGVGGDDTEQIIKIQVLGPVTGVPVDSSTAINEKLVAGATAGQLGRQVAFTAVADAMAYTVLGIAVTTRDGTTNTSTVYLLNPLGL